MEQTSIETTPAAPQGLKYLFTVLYHDRSTFQQNASDISTVDPLKSAFTDAIHRIENGKFVKDAEGNLVSRMEDVYRFMLFAEDDSEHSYMVDMATGHFEANCIPFRFHEIEVPYYNRRLIFLRRHYRQMILQNGTMTPGPERVVYRLGWQANLSTGKNVQFVMEVD